nr:hypothetical protein [uncultured Blautia sp.]
MKIKELRNHIENLISDLEFSYDGVDGSICPINRNEIYLSYGHNNYDARSVDEAMKIPFIAGQALENIGEKLEFY